MSMEFIETNYIARLGSVKEAFLLTQLVHWQDHENEQFNKTLRDENLEELGFTQEDLTRFYQKLHSLGVLIVKQKPVSEHHNYYIHVQALEKINQPATEE